MQFWLFISVGDIAHLPGIARAAESAGFEGVMLPDHIVTPREIASRYRYGAASADGKPPWPEDRPWADPLTSFAAMAAVTTTLRFATYVMVVPMREPLTLAKQVATVSVLSGGRVALGVGVGWLREEFEILGQEFANRGRRLDEMIEVMRAVWRGGWVTQDGPSYQLPAFRQEPPTVSPVPIWIGGDGPAAVRRAVAIGDGWVGPNLPPDVLPARVAEVRRALAEAGRSEEGFQLMATPMVQGADALWPLADLGLTGVIVSPPRAAPGAGPTPLAATCEAIERLGGSLFAGRR